jgi:hypothetical protein
MAQKQSDAYQDRDSDDGTSDTTRLGGQGALPPIYIPCIICILLTIFSLTRYTQSYAIALRMKSARPSPFTRRLANLILPF